jgi:hypothetical protein
MTMIQRTLAALFALAAGSAMAGPDFFVIEQARKAHAAAKADAAVSAQQGTDNRKAVLPLDHGPRAQSTPFLNARRKV